MKITAKILAAPQNLQQYLAGQFAMGPKLPNAFQLVKPILSFLVDVALLVELDPYAEKWDPAWGKRGQNECYMLDVSAKTDVGGKSYEGHDYLGGSWDMTNDEHQWVRNDCHGYLPELTQEALRELTKELAGVEGAEGERQVIQVAIMELDWLMQATNNEQQRIYAPLPKRPDHCYYFEPTV